jgi:hypothetical protein
MGDTTKVATFHSFFNTAKQNRLKCITCDHGIKTPNPKCRLYWYIVKFIDWRYSQPCWYFRPLLRTSAPLTFSMVHLHPPPSPFPCVNKYRPTEVCVHTVCNGGGGGDRGPQTDKHLPSPSTFTSQFLRKADI